MPKSHLTVDGLDADEIEFAQQEVEMAYPNVRWMTDEPANVGSTSERAHLVLPYEYDDEPA